MVLFSAPAPSCVSSFWGHFYPDRVPGLFEQRGGGVVSNKGGRGLKKFLPSQQDRCIDDCIQSRSFKRFLQNDVVS